MFKSSRSEYCSQKCITRVFFCLPKNVYEVIGVQYTALCGNEKNEKNQHPNPAQQELVPVDDAINITAYHLQNAALLCIISHTNTK